jgi:hypothetical protein
MGHNPNGSNEHKIHLNWKNFGWTVWGSNPIGGKKRLKKE